MLLPTNDAFAGLNAVAIPTTAGSYTFDVPAYDAGTEANPNVHIHRGSLGDTDAAGGSSDLDSRVHRWLNPVIRVTITVN